MCPVQNGDNQQIQPGKVTLGNNNIPAFDDEFTTFLKTRIFHHYFIKRKEELFVASHKGAV